MLFKRTVHKVKKACGVQKNTNLCAAGFELSPLTVFSNINIVFMITPTAIRLRAILKS